MSSCHLACELHERLARKHPTRWHIVLHQLWWWWYRLLSVRRLEESSVSYGMDRPGCCVMGVYSVPAAA